MLDLIILSKVLNYFEEKIFFDILLHKIEINTQFHHNKQRKNLCL